MQKMLHKSFKPAKCKTALRLAIPRIKVMKNKREAQAKQLKRELAQLLESGQDQTARIRVEHVVREEKTVDAYNLLQIYCELIVARMPMIESQKNCPIDLKEAIASVIFASARCEDIPELKDASKHFTAKYGKEFTSAALEMRPNCGVSRTLVEKLSAIAPDGPTKLKILTTIAEEHNINWDPASFGAKESKVYDDKLVRLNTEATRFSSYPSNVQGPTSSYEQRPASVQVPNYDKGPPSVRDTKHVKKNDMPSSFSEYSSRSSPKNFGYSNTGADNLMNPETYSPNSKPLGTGNQGFRHSYSGNESAYSSPRQHWNMNFKDATAAAQAAAESAEIASMAARAAAELSSRGNFTQQYSMESPVSPLHRMREEEPRKYTGSASQNERLGRDPVDISFHGRNSGNYEQIDSFEEHGRGRDNGNVYSNIVRSSDNSAHGSFKSTASSFKEKTSVNNQTADAYSQRHSFRQVPVDHFAEVNSARKSGENGDHQNVSAREQSSYSYSHSQSNSFTDDHDVASNFNQLKTENDTKSSGFTDYQEARIRKQSSHSSSHSHSSTFSDDHDVVSNLNRWNSGDNSGEDSFLHNDKGSLQRSTKETTYFFNNASAVFDDYVSDNNEDRFDSEEEHDTREFSMNLSSPGQRSPTRPYTRTNSRSIEKNVDGKSISESHIFSEQRSTSVFFESSASSADPSFGDDLPAAFDDYGPSSESDEEIDKSKFVRSSKPSTGSNVKNMDSYQAENSNFDSQSVEVMEDTEQSKDSSLEEGMKLNFGNLTGGLRHKGYRLPPYTNSPRADGLPSVEAANGASTRTKQFSPPAAAEASVGSVSFNQEPYTRKSNDEVNRKFSMRASNTHVDPSDDDSEEERPKQTSTSTQDRVNQRSSFEDLPKKKAPTDTGFSRKTTKASPSNSRRSSNLKATAFSEPKVVSDYSGKGSGEVNGKFRMRASSTRVDSSDDDSEKRRNQTFSSTQDQQNNTPSFEENRRSSLRVAVTYSGSDEGLPKASLNASSNTGFSRRTKASPSNSQSSSTLKDTVASDYGQEKDSSSRTSNADESLPKTRPQKKNSDDLSARSRHPQLSSQATSRLVLKTNSSSSDTTFKPSEKEQSSTSIPKIIPSPGAKSLTTQTSTGEGQSKQNASHVHPKLPDIDILTAHLNSIRQNHR
ncbi:uncharacterized protein LOC120211843 isoform X1 [Hibiscus syriacus]|uniref:uncharacterized protein LOC120211843 isoform X1 n=1 Tax=Hibiscus syriacus TaxID=106335 RepID=UPI0019216885|nr:uncharacterized protein LOC120211843 isoform X1 [Hibiscus syriacus]XP_039066237.1 uncharacterized protein LOC120211843 isoform X1 [Hibiscus syriacus]